LLGIPVDQISAVRVPSDTWFRKYPEACALFPSSLLTTFPAVGYAVREKQKGRERERERELSSLSLSLSLSRSYLLLSHSRHPGLSFRGCSRLDSARRRCHRRYRHRRGAQLAQERIGVVGSVATRRAPGERRRMMRSCDG